jgi:hypothetical protein
MFQVEDVESLNSRVIVVVNLDEIPLTSSVDSEVPHSPIAKVKPFHVIFNLDEVLITTCFDRGFCIVIFASWNERIHKRMPCSIPSLYLVYNLASQYI